MPMPSKYIVRVLGRDCTQVVLEKKRARTLSRLGLLEVGSHPQDREGGVGVHGDAGVDAKAALAATQYGVQQHVHVGFMCCKVCQHQLSLAFTRSSSLLGMTMEPGPGQAVFNKFS